MSRQTKPCVRCGKLLYWVESRTLYCPACREKIRLERQEMHRTIPKQQQKKKSAPKKSLAQCADEAKKLNITYGEYVRQGYDKMELSI